MTKAKPGPICRDDTYMWQLDEVSGVNLWSGKLGANNGYPQEHALKAAALFEAAPDLLEALRGLLPQTFTGNPTQAELTAHWERERDLGNGMAPFVLAAYAAIAKAEGQS